MCESFALAENPQSLKAHFNLIGALELAPSWNITPWLNIAAA
jgi:hypothetical protein